MVSMCGGDLLRSEGGANGDISIDTSNDIRSTESSFRVCIVVDDEHGIGWVWWFVFLQLAEETVDVVGLSDSVPDDSSIRKVIKKMVLALNGIHRSLSKKLYEKLHP
ncbi:hypothetical protein M413DRAFT_271960 [Hebeloma cylindrosporum]|uniref:Uncharacterized protein n=1 Tax=Hebeloma cylindrosporum TaxID=76867 RepID=A0A0C3CT64_HEBCY|nr:hypothetical protein M413DRAFT_271960 [Hebeloma cylindrosporum h7]